MQADLPAIATWLQKNKLISKPLNEFNKLEMVGLIEAIAESIDPTSGWHPPYLKDGRELVIPASAPRKYRYWQGGQDLKITLEELGASNEIVSKYCVSPKDKYASHKY